METRPSFFPTQTIPEPRGFPRSASDQRDDDFDTVTVFFEVCLLIASGDSDDSGDSVTVCLDVVFFRLSAVYHSVFVFKYLHVLRNNTFNIYVFETKITIVMREEFVAEKKNKQRLLVL